MEFIDLTFTTGEVAELTATNLNTVQSWRRKGLFAINYHEGWHRFSLSDLFSVVAFAHVTKPTNGYELASSASSFALQMFEEVIENGASPYFIGATCEDGPPLMEITYGARDVGRVLYEKDADGSNAGAYVVVDYCAISQRLLKRLHAAGYADKVAGKA